MNLKQINLILKRSKQFQTKDSRNNKFILNLDELCRKYSHRESLVSSLSFSRLTPLVSPVHNPLFRRTMLLSEIPENTEELWGSSMGSSSINLCLSWHSLSSWSRNSVSPLFPISSNAMNSWASWVWTLLSISSKGLKACWLWTLLSVSSKGLKACWGGNPLWNTLSFSSYIED